MSDLSATNCGCGNSRENSGNGCCSLIWLIILFSLFNNDGCGCGCGNGFNFFNNGSDGCGCSSIIWLLILFSCCGSPC